MEDEYELDMDVEFVSNLVAKAMVDWEILHRLVDYR